ncbi:hypothetical protein F3K36_00180 [Delftia sp. BR1]|nr:hypothetical protein F3K36_00180 [Delftia sp. BR1]
MRAPPEALTRLPPVCTAPSLASREGDDAIAARRLLLGVSELGRAGCMRCAQYPTVFCGAALTKAHGGLPWAFFVWRFYWFSMSCLWQQSIRSRIFRGGRTFFDMPAPRIRSSRKWH